MAVVAAQDLPVEGLDAVQWSNAQSGGDEVPTGRDLLLLVRNGDASSHNVTIATPVTVDGIAVADVTRAVAAGAIAAVPMADPYRSRTTGRASLTWAATTGMTFAVLRLP